MDIYAMGELKREGQKDKTQKRENFGGKMDLRKQKRDRKRRDRERKKERERVRLDTEAAVKVEEKHLPLTVYVCVRACMCV